MNKGFHEMESRAAAAVALRGRAADRLAGAQARVGGFAVPFTLGAPGEEIRLTAAQEAALHKGAAEATERVMAMFALMISEAEADAAAMSDLVEVIGGMEGDFFVYAECPEKCVQREVAEYGFSCVENMI